MRAIVLDAPGPRRPSDPATSRCPGLLRDGSHRGAGIRPESLRAAHPAGFGEGVTFPRVLGIEATGTVAECPGGEFAVGQQVAAMMGGMGRTFDGGYAEYTCVPARQVVPFTSKLDWATLGAVPEMLQTAYGSLTIGLDA